MIDEASKGRRVALQGDPSQAIAILKTQAALPDVSATLAELYAFLWQWENTSECAGRFLRAPWCVHASNVFDDMIRLILLSAQKTGNWQGAVSTFDMTERGIQQHDTVDWVKTRWLKWIAAAKQSAVAGGKPIRNPFETEGETEAPLSPAEVSLPDNTSNPSELAKALQLLRLSAQHSDAMRLYSDVSPRRLLLFDHAVYIAEMFVQSGNIKRATKILLDKVPGWQPVEHCQVAPVSILYSPIIGKIVTRELADCILRTPRGPEERFKK